MAAGKQLPTTFKQLSAQLSTISSQAGEQYNALTGPSGEVENYANQIAQLNGQIKLSEEAGQPPNEMLDRRDLLLDKLSCARRNITVTEAPDHTDTVSFGEAAKPLVEGTTVNWPQTLTESAGGQLGALLGLTGPERRAHRAADGPRQRRGNAREHRQRHTSRSRSSPAQPRRRSRWRSNPRSPGVRDRKAAGGNEVAQRDRGAARRRRRTGLRGARREGRQRRATAAKDEQTNLQTTVTAISDQRQSVSGVSLDEEMTNLITFQRGYQASARTLTAMSEMLETLIEHTGVVGL